MTALSGSLEGRTALVTGGSGGIGLAVARTLAGLGARVAVNHPGGGPGSGELPGGCFAVEADVRDRRQVTAMFRTAADRFGGLDILVNNAGVFPAPIRSTSTRRPGTWFWTPTSRAPSSALRRPPRS